MIRELYFDSNSTTRVHPEVVRVMNDVMLKDYGNPSSLHALGDETMKIGNLTPHEILRNKKD
ncbi:MAG: hypothetical protein AABW89_05975 [Nanoarchaeota archaeon]